MLGYLLLYALALVMPITVATQLLVSAAVVAIPLLTGRLLRAAGADERWRWLAIPCSFGFAFYWGFLSFIVAAPLALLFLIRTIGFVKQPSCATRCRSRSSPSYCSSATSSCSASLRWWRSATSSAFTIAICKALVLHALPYTAPLPLIGVWLAVTYDSEARVQNDPVSFGPLSYRLLNLLTQPAGREDLSAGRRSSWWS